MSEAQPRVVQEREGQVWLTPDARKAPTQRRTERGEIRRAHVGEFARLDVAPDLFDRVQFRRRGRQALYGEPRSLASQIVAHATALVATQAVPNEDDSTATEMPFERVHERDEDAVRVSAGMRLKEEPTAAAVPAKGEGARDGEAFPVPARVRQDRRLAARGPRAADDGLLGDAAFVLEDEPRVLPPGVFFKTAQRRLFHCAMAASSRSRARRAGRWSDQPKARSTRQTWPG